MALEMRITGSDGRRYDSLAEMIEAEGRALIDQHINRVERAIRAQRCGVHGKSATTKVRRTGDRYSFDISGCCDALIERAQAAAQRVR
jgi:hypothetical protein